MNLRVDGLQLRKLGLTQVAGKDRTSRRITSNRQMAAEVCLPSAGANPTPLPVHLPETF